MFWWFVLVAFISWLIGYIMASFDIYRETTRNLDRWFW